MSVVELAGAAGKNANPESRMASSVSPRSYLSDDPVLACRTSVILVADALRVPVEEIVAGARGSARSARARQAAMYLAHVALGISLTAVGRFFGRDHSTVAHGCHRVEDRRDHPDFDALIAELALAARIALNLDREIAA